MPVKKKAPDAQFLNVDLDVYSRSDLQRLVKRFRQEGDRFVRRPREEELLRSSRIGRITKTSADSTVRAFCTLIRALPKTERELWNAAKTREFSVGVQAGQQTFARDFRTEAQTVKAVAELGAVIVLTVYGPERAKRRNVSK
jgi:hypothetical protein